MSVDRPRICPGIGETVLRAAIQMHLPIDPGVAHLLLEGDALRRRDQRIVRAEADEHLALDVS
jgi:hypothetical protein